MALRISSLVSNVSAKNSADAAEEAELESGLSKMAESIKAAELMAQENNDDLNDLPDLVQLFEAGITAA